MDDRARRAELKAFLRSRRAGLSPEQAGFVRGKRRLTEGLRREELAALAGVGLTWYTWLEQGRAINPSARMLSRVSRALRLSRTDEAYLFTLAGQPAPLVSQQTDVTQLPTLQRVLDGFTAGPAVIFDPVFDVLAFNSIWERIYAPGDYRGPFASNHIYRMFMDSDRRRLYVDHDAVAQNMVGLLRGRYADHIGDRRFEELIAQLGAVSPEFTQLWSGHQTQALDLFHLRLRHPTMGALALHATRFPVEDIRGALVFFGAPADQATEAALGGLDRSGM
jgi:transcriptional regulator with XRE-family HTH domain